MHVQVVLLKTCGEGHSSTLIHSHAQVEGFICWPFEHANFVAHTQLQVSESKTWLLGHLGLRHSHAQVLKLNPRGDEQRVLIEAGHSHKFDTELKIWGALQTGLLLHEQVVEFKMRSFWLHNELDSKHSHWHVVEFWKKLVEQFVAHFNWAVCKSVTYFWRFAVEIWKLIENHSFLIFS
jgi:hypothetical protein